MRVRRHERKAPSGFESPTADLVAAEYNAARADCLQGLIGQQSILTWSIAAIGVLFAAGLSIDTKVHGASTVRPWVFLVGVPLLTLGVSIAWLGEIFRMERDAHYMRLLEQSTWPADLLRAYRDNEDMVTDDMVKRGTLMLNTWVARGAPPSRNRVVGYFGGILIYLGATAGALAVGGALLRSHSGIAFICGGGWCLVYAAITVVQLARIVDYSRLGLGESMVDLASPRVPRRTRSKRQ
jgi:hypothetical protein